jgi:hypothetical protein
VILPVRRLTMGRLRLDQLKNLPSAMAFQQKGRPTNVALRGISVPAGQRTNDPKSAGLGHDSRQAIGPAHPRPVEQNHLHGVVPLAIHFSACYDRPYYGYAEW